MIMHRWLPSCRRWSMRYRPVPSAPAPGCGRAAGISIGDARMSVYGVCWQISRFHTCKRQSEIGSTSLMAPVSASCLRPYPRHIVAAPAVSTHVSLGCAPDVADPRDANSRSALCYPLRQSAHAGRLNSTLHSKLYRRGRVAQPVLARCWPPTSALCHRMRQSKLAGCLDSTSRS
jgi:hypothetical protein